MIPPPHRFLALTLAVLFAPIARATQDPPGLAFVAAERCALCHSESPRASAMRDASGESVAPYELWRTSMMGSAARDVVWRAVLSAEVASLPHLREAIESKCLRCHAPVLAATPEGTLDARSSLNELGADTQMASIARGGVLCLVCHQILPDGLGEDASFSGGPLLNLERRAFGPHPSPFTRPMRMHSGFTPAEGAHVLRPALCGTCHTLFTPTHDAGGQALGTLFGEQTPYLEWRSSAFCDEGDQAGSLALTCQDCHLPTTDRSGSAIETRIARNPGGRDFPPIRPRRPFGRHVLAGGNTLVPELLAAQASRGEDDVPAEAYLAKAEATRDQLAGAAVVSIHDVERDGASLRFAVEVANLAGHKLPTGHPARRAWLRVRVRTAGGETVFASGEVDRHGRLLGPDGAPAPQELAEGPIWSHRQRVTAPDQVQVYEAVMADSTGAATFRLLAGATWAKDDRILPIGFDPSHEDAPHVRPFGVDGDDDFAGGFDRVLYELDVPISAGGFTIEAELCYQPLGARWLAELAVFDTPEVRQLLDQLERTPLTTEVVSRTRAGGGD